MFEKVQGVKEQRFKDCELFHEQSFHVTIDRTPKNGDLQAAYQIMVRQGVKTTTSQELSVKTDWQTTICECLTSIQFNPEARKHLTGLTFDNFWLSDEWELPYNNLIEHVISFIQSSQETRKNLMIGGIKEDWEVIEQAIRDTTASPAYFLGIKDQGKAPTHLSKSLSIVLVLLKFLVIDKTNLEQMRMLFQNTEWTTEQGETFKDDFSVF